MRTAESALLGVLGELQGLHCALTAHYRWRLSGAPPGPRLQRWQSRTQSALRASEKAAMKTAASIRRLKRQLAQEGSADEHRR